MNQYKNILFYFGMFLLRNLQIDASATSSVTWPQASVVAAITGCTNQGFLPYPYTSIQQDPTSKMYAVASSAPISGATLVSSDQEVYAFTYNSPIPGITFTNAIPASASNVSAAPASVLTYTFFNIPNNFPSVNGKPANIAATYDANGNLLATIQDPAYSNLLTQYGIAINPTGIIPALPPTALDNGTQCLAACNQQPVMLLNPADVALTPGNSGISMISSSNSNFPSPGITSPISYNNSKFYFYYNNLMQTYFAMAVAGNAISYINISNGCTYNIDGTSQILNNPVGVSSSGSQSDFFLPYINNDGYLQCLMQQNGAANTYSDYSNTESSFVASATDPSTNQPAACNALVQVNTPNTNVNVYQMPLPAPAVPPLVSQPLIPMLDLTIPTQYSVYWNPPTAVPYLVNATYQWQNLQCLPINMTSRVLINPAPASNYTTAGIILQNNIIFAVVFNGIFFKANATATKTSYVLTSPSNQNGTLTINTDPTTQVKYVTIVVGQTTYSYQYKFLTLSPTQLQMYQSNAWMAGQATTSAGAVALVKNLPLVNNAVQVSPITTSMVQNLPSASALSNLQSIVKDTTNNRFLTLVYPPQAASFPSYTYLTQTYYVDLATGILFTTQGVTAGSCLLSTDLSALLAQLNVSVVTNNNQTLLNYNANSATQSTQAATGADSSLTDDDTTDDSAPSSFSSTAPVAPAPVALTPAQQITALQTKNNALQSDITNRQTKINNYRKEQKGSSTVQQEIQANQTGITMDTNEIAANNKEIATLQVSAAQSRSTVLGRLSSKKTKSKKAKSKLLA